MLEHNQSSEVSYQCAVAVERWLVTRTLMLNIATSQLEA
jgi:hypothetical protein